MKFLLLKHRYNIILWKTESLGMETVAAALKANGVDFVYHDENFLSRWFRFTRLKKAISKNKITHLGITTNPNDVKKP